MVIFRYERVMQVVSRRHVYDFNESLNKVASVTFPHREQIFAR